MRKQTIKQNKYDSWEVKNSIDILRRAGEIVNDKKYLKVLKKEIAKEQEASKQIISWASGLD